MSRFKTKGTTENEFQIGINGPILKRFSQSSTNELLLPDNIYLNNVYFGSNKSKYINSSFYTGKSAQTDRLSHKIGIVSGDENVILSSSLTDGYPLNDDSNANIELTFSSINASLLFGNIDYARISNLVGTSENTIAAGNHNHNGVYVEYGKTIEMPSTSSLKFRTTDDYTILSSSPIELDLILKDNSVGESNIIDNSITTTKILDDNITVSKLEKGDYSSKIDLVAKALSANSAETANKLSTAYEIWGHAFDGTANISGDILNSGSITPLTSATYNIGTSNLKFKDGYFSGQLNFNNLSGQSATLTGNLSAGTITVSKLTNSGDLIVSGSSSLKNITTTKIVNSGSTELNGTLTVSGASVFKNNIDASTYNITAELFYGDLSGTASKASQLVNPHTIWGKTFDGTQDISGDLNLNGTLSNVTKLYPTAATDSSIGSNDNKFNSIYANTFYGTLNGNASSATTASRLNNSLQIFYLNDDEETSISFNGSTANSIRLAAENIIGLPDFISNRTASYKGEIVFSSTEKIKYTPDAKKGDMYFIVVPKGTSGCTLNGIFVTNGTLAICILDSAAGNAENSENISLNWKYIIIPEISSNTVLSTASDISDGDIAVFDGTSGTLIKNIPSTSYLSTTGNKTETVTGLKTFANGLKIGSNWDFSSDDYLKYNNYNIVMPDEAGTLSLISDIVPTARASLKNITVGDQVVNLFDNELILSKVALSGSYNDLTNIRTLSLGSEQTSSNTFSYVSNISVNDHQITLTKENLGKATNTILGLVKTGYSTNEGNKQYAVNIDSSGNLYTTVNWKNDNTTYTFEDGTNGSFTVTPSNGDSQTVQIGKPSTAGTADIANKTSGTLSFKYGETTFPNYNFNGSQNIEVDFGEMFKDLNSLKNKGTINFSSTEKTKYTPNANSGDLYFVSFDPVNLTNCTLNGVEVNNGDMVLCNVDNTPAANSDNYTDIQKNWSIIKANNINEDNLVHLSGSETISGDKTFTGKLITKKIYTDSSNYIDIPLSTTGTFALRSDIDNVKASLKNIIIDSHNYNLFNESLTLSKVSLTGSYNDLVNAPSITLAGYSPIDGRINFIDSLSPSNHVLTVTTKALKYLTFNASENSINSTENLAGSSTDSATILLNNIAKTGLKKNKTAQTGSGTQVVSDIIINGGNEIQLSKINVLTSHQTLKTLNTNNTSSQSTSSSESLTGSGTINLHKVAKTGNYNDLVNRPSIPVIPDIQISGSVGTNQFIKNITLSGTNNHTLTLVPGDIPEATTQSYGGIKIATTKRGTLISASTGDSSSKTNHYCGVELDSSGKAFVNVPYNEINTSVFLTTNTEQTVLAGANKTINSNFIFGTTTMGKATKTILNTSKAILNFSDSKFYPVYFSNGVVGIGSSSSQPGFAGNYLTGMSAAGSPTHLIVNYDNADNSLSRQLLLGATQPGSSINNTLERNENVPSENIYSYAAVRGDYLRKLLNYDLTKSAQWINSKTLSVENLDDYHSADLCGFYYASGSNSCINKPDGVDSFGLIVFRGASGIFIQYLYDCHNNGSADDARFYVRHYYNNWTSWKKQATINDIPALPTNHVTTDTEQTISGYKTFDNAFFNNINGNVLDIHPENTEAFNLSYYVNDLHNLIERGGSCTISGFASGGASDYNIKNLFNGNTAYSSFSASSSTDTVTILIKSPTNFNYTNKIGIGFGVSNWKANYVKFELAYSANGEPSSSAWYKCFETSSYYGPIALAKGVYNASSGDGNTWNWLRITLSDFNTPADVRIAGIWVANMGSSGLAESYASRSGTEFYGDVTVPSLIGTKGIFNSSLNVAGTTLSNGSYTVLNTSKSLLQFSGNQLYLKNGAVFGGSAAQAGLVTRGICGVNISSTTITKENLYINYDSDNTYRNNRQLVLQAGTIGSNYGQNVYQYCAVRGDALKNYIEQVAVAYKAKQLNTARSLWGQNFDGTSNITGNLSSTGNITPSSNNASNIGSSTLKYKTGYFATSVNIGSATVQYNSDDECLDFVF